MPTEATTLPPIVDSSTSAPPGPPQGQGLDICGIEIDDGANPVDRHPFRRSTIFLLDNEVRVRVLFYFETNLFFFSRGSPHSTSRSWRPPQSIQAETRLLLGKYRSQAQENYVFLDRLITTIINDRYEFPVQLDLDRENGKYLSPDVDRTVRNLYTLHSVFVHSGGVHGGHYYAFIRPTLSDQWYKFDDERVTKEDVKRASEEQYGGEEELPQTNPGYNNTPFKFTKYSNAYMLVYIRE
ncbi:ubiquitin carboxyl-terminal hydrolase 12-like [Iris pallida]|uniref:Ubiquitin carboxyl-terminal hydrolase 12-like n=1 Tax=Iris pallida TaxID=29817 RepID=A0AAX6FG25_IRIPA|nr:ubiquitin carboxyl-terminal hydrolase 12-like [Iris pallida]